MEDPPRLAHQTILEEEQAMADNVVDVLPRCGCIMEIVQAGIDKGLFLNGSEVREFLDVIMGRHM